MKLKAKETLSTPSPHFLVTEAISQKAAHMEYNEGPVHFNELPKIKTDHSGYLYHTP